MYSIDLAWKSFNVNMDAVEAWMRANAGAYYCGNSADTDLTLHFTQKPDDATVTAINAYWSGITDGSSEATTYVTQTAIRAAIAAAQTDAVSRPWDQLTVAQRKLLVGIAPSRADLGL